MGNIGTGVSSQVPVCFSLLHNVKEGKAKYHKAQSDICESICDSEITIYGDRLLSDRQTDVTAKYYKD
jgi:hypothetical protein